MKKIVADLGRSLTSIEIVPIADAHLGDPQADEQLLRNKLRYIDETPNAYAIINGDLMNNATKASVSDSYNEVMSPMEQIVKAVMLLQPIASKILCISTGNHEVRTARESGIDITRLIARELGIEDRYSDGSIVLFLRLGNTGSHNSFRPQRYTMLVNHGRGGGRREGGKANALADMASIADCDIYLMSHTHLPLVFKQAFYRVDNNNSSIALVEKLFVNTGAYLGYGGYGERAMFKPTSKAQPVIQLSGTNREMSVKL